MIRLRQIPISGLSTEMVGRSSEIFGQIARQVGLDSMTQPRAVQLEIGVPVPQTRRDLGLILNNRPANRAC